MSSWELSPRRGSGRRPRHLKLATSFPTWLDFSPTAPGTLKHTRGAQGSLRSSAQWTDLTEGRNARARPRLPGKPQHIRVGDPSRGCEQCRKDTVQGLKAQALQTPQSSVPPGWRCPQGRVPLPLCFSTGKAGSGTTTPHRVRQQVQQTKAGKAVPFSPPILASNSNAPGGRQV